jgi:hypothetical protein
LSVALPEAPQRWQTVFGSSGALIVRGGFLRRGPTVAWVEQHAIESTRPSPADASSKRPTCCRPTSSACAHRASPL